MAARTRAEAPGHPLRVRFSPAERILAERAAAVNRQSLSAFLRDAAVTAAAECLEGRVAILRLTRQG